VAGEMRENESVQSRTSQNSRQCASQNGREVQSVPRETSHPGNDLQNLQVQAEVSKQKRRKSIETRKPRKSR